MHKTGKVFLVGAGPGDPELLTLKAVKAIAMAEVILIDDLVNPDVLQYARASVRIVQVGKRGGCQQTPQAFIEKLMLAEAKAGHCVVRLKGGDPFIFGRGGEERQHLMAQGVAVEVISGISSGLAAATSLGIPLTHREHAQGVIFVTGHGQTADKNPDWATLAKSGLTLVIYMGVAQCASIQAGLIAGGLSASTPVAVIQSATRNNQAQLISTLGRLAEDLSASGLGSPSVIVVGEVVACADQVADLLQVCA